MFNILLCSIKLNVDEHESSLTDSLAERVNQLLRDNDGNNELYFDIIGCKTDSYE